jgi:hypothetical protein
MSVILDVLKKLDREKPSRRNEAPNIAIDILRPDLPRSGKRVPLYIGIISFTAIATAVITFGLMKEFGLLSKSSPSAPMNPPVSSRQTRPAPMEMDLQTKSSPPVSVSPPAPSQPVGPTSLSRESVPETKEDINKVFPKMEAPPATKAPAETKVLIESKPLIAPPDEKKPIQNVIPEKKEVVPGTTSKKGPEPSVSESPASPPSLKLSVIVWYEEPSMRFAMINGLKAVEGAVIEGVKVVEIKPTSVRLLHNNRYFEISMPR